MQSENHLAPYTIQSKNTKFFIITTPHDKDGREVHTASQHGVLQVTPIKGQVVPQVVIQGIHKLYVALEGTKVVWSSKEYMWVVRETGGNMSYVVTPEDGKDLYLIDIGDHLQARPGKDIQPPQNEFLFTPLLRK